MVNQALVDAIRGRQVVLFVGSGVSRALGLPSWKELMDQMARELGHDPILIHPAASYLTIAEYYKLQKGSIGKLRSWMDRRCHLDDEAIRNSEVHRLITNLDFKFIYTTNYDALLERAFELHRRPYAKIIDASDVAKASDDVTHIVKFHGDFEDDSTIVLAESDYFERLTLDHPLDLRFRADILGRTVLFIGYSLTDLNMRLLLFKMQKMWSVARRSNERPQSFLFMNKPDRIQERVLASWGIQTLIKDDATQETALVDFLSELAQALTK